MTQSTEIALSVNDLRRTFADRQREVRAVDGVSFDVAQGEFYTLLGPSGCGKTTTLRSVAGLERIDGGTIAIDRQIVSSDRSRDFMPCHKRDIAMVFQNYGVWPHMSVFDNVAFPLRVVRPRLSSSQIESRVVEALESVELGEFRERMAPALSGGQQQRLALARALVRKPKLLLLDEPLSNLDAKLRDSMRAEVRRLQRRLGITTLYVTHDQTEALSMSTRIAIMKDGKIVQEGEPRDIYFQPRTRFVAEFIGSTNLVEGTALAGTDGGMVRAETPIGPVTATSSTEVTAGQQVTIACRPESIGIVEDATAPDETPNSYQAEVEQVMFEGNAVECRLRVGHSLLQMRAESGLEVDRGDRIVVRLPPTRCSVLAS